MAWHRAEGFVALGLFALVGYLCVTRLTPDWTDARVAVHAVSAMLVFAVLGIKLLIVRVFHRAGRLVPALGIVIVVAALTTVATSAAWYLYSAWIGGPAY